MKLFAPALAATVLLLPSLGALSADPSPESKAAYEAACARCHDVGMMGAPVTDSPSDWADRAEIGEAALNDHAEKGLLRGGVDDTAKQAAAYMQAVTAAK